jgi:lipid A 3-O-deacylase
MDMSVIFKNLPRQLMCLLFSLICILQTTSATPIWQGASFAAGYNFPNTTMGGRISYQWQPTKTNWQRLPMYFEVSAGLWYENFGPHKWLANLSVAPVLRYHLLLGHPITPYLEVSVGPSLQSTKHIGHRKLGSRILFQDLFGGGVNFGAKHQYDFSLRYLHYSDAGIVPPNDGVDIQLLGTFGIRW